MAYDDDSPLIDPSSDAFGLAPFSRRLARLLISSRVTNNFVVGLNGEWGSGKSSVFNFALAYIVAAESAGLNLETISDGELIDALAKLTASSTNRSSTIRSAEQSSQGRLHGTVFIRYNPWLVSGRDTLISDFFRILGDRASVLAQSGDVRRRIRRAAYEVARFTEGAAGTVGHYFDYTGIVALAADPTGASSAGAKVGSWVARRLQSTANAIAQRTGDPPATTLDGARDKLRNALADTGRKFIVVIDDLDRLAPSEVRPLLSMVKSVGRLPNVTYLLGYDRQLIESALGDSDLPESRRFHFLEKIVQVEVDLPRVPPTRVEAALMSWLPTLLGREVTSGEESDLSIDLVYGRSFLDTPRDLVRLKNSLTLLRANTGSELLITDVIRLELIRLHERVFFDWLMSHRGIFFGGVDRIVKWQSEEQRKEFIATGLSFVSSERRDTVARWLSRTLSEFRDRGEFSDAYSRDPKLGWPLRSAEGWHAYSQLYPQEDTLTQEEWREVARVQDDAESSGVLLNSFMTRRRSDGATMLHSLVDDLPRFIRKPPSPEGLFLALLRTTGLWLSVPRSMLYEAAIYHLLELVAAERRFIFLKTTFESDQRVPLETMAIVVLSLGRPFNLVWRDSEHRRTEPLLREEQVRDLATFIARRIEAMSSGDVGLANRHIALLELYALATTTLKASLLSRKILAAGGQGAIGIIRKAVERMTSARGSTFVYSPLDEKRSEIFSTSEMVLAAKQLLGSEVSADDRELLVAFLDGTERTRETAPTKPSGPSSEPRSKPRSRAAKGAGRRSRPTDDERAREE